jgi:hypothetical protein
MNAKALARMVLLAVVAIALAAWARKEFGPAAAVARGDDSASASGGAELTRPDGVSVILFHGEKRCRTCIRIGTLAREVLEQAFAEEEKAGVLHWAEINYDQPAHAHFVKRYELVSSTVLLTRWKDGREAEWKRLDAVWDHVGDEAAYRAYLSREVNEQLLPDTP